MSSKNLELMLSVIIGCDFCKMNVEAIRSRICVVEIDDGSTISIIMDGYLRIETIFLRQEARKYMRKRDFASKATRTRKSDLGESKV